MTGLGAAQPWHIDADALSRWVDGVAGPVMSTSVEQHVLRCAQCQAAVAALVPQAPLQPVWENVLAELEVPRAAPSVRLLRHLGLTSSDASVIVSALGLRASWLLGVIGVLGFTVVSAILGHSGGVGLFLIAAPLIPVAGVAASFGPSVDPSYELVLAAPYVTVRLVLLRTAAVLVTSAPFAIIAGLFLPTTPAIAVAWLLPAAGFVVVVLAASTWVDAEIAAAVVGVGWIAVVGLAIRHGHPLAVFAPIPIVTYLALAAVAGLILLRRLVGAVPSWRLR
jgi:hypothetical protein